MTIRFIRRVTKLTLSGNCLAKEFFKYFMLIIDVYDITCQANVKAVTSAHCPQCKMVSALIGNVF